MNNDLPNYIVNYENEKGKNDNEIHVMHVLRKYAKAGNQAAISFLARRLRAMNCLKTDDRANLNIFKRFSNNGNHVMTRFIAVYYLQLSNQKNDRWARASIVYFEKAYMQGCNLSLLWLADCYMYHVVDDTTSLTLEYTIKAANLNATKNTYIKVGEKTNLAALLTMGKYYYKCNPQLAVNYFMRAALSVKQKNDIEESTFHALFYLGLLAAKSVHSPIDFFQVRREKKTSLSYDLVQAIMFMRLADTDDANEWLSTRGLSKIDGLCAECDKPAKVACDLCKFSFFCSRQCFYEMGLHYHEHFCLSHAEDEK